MLSYNLLKIIESNFSYLKKNAHFYSTEMVYFLAKTAKENKALWFFKNVVLQCFESGQSNHYI